MDVLYASKYHELEENHWWFIGRRDIIFRLIKDYQRDVEILEIGCSGGVLIEFLKKRGFLKLHGIDIDEKAIEICRQRVIKKVGVADAQETGFKEQQFDILIASDVLEHIKNEDKALLEWYRILKPGGTLIIFVPAFKFLWSNHDEVNCHYRRYSKSGLIKIVEKNSFKTERVSYWNFSLFFPISLVRFFRKFLPGNRKRASDQLFEFNTVVNKTLEYILRLENKFLSTGINLPIGVSLFIIGRKI
jgi:ubiquinone/menaquinone biosynthesis C-methylase UbiE